MMLSRAKPAVGGAPPQGDKRKKKGKKVPQLEELLAQRDFTGAIALLEFKRHVGEQDEDTDLWIGYCAFHLGDYKRALEEYEGLSKQSGCNPDVWVNLACTYFLLGMYTQAEQAGLKAPKSRLQNRLLFHLAHKPLQLQVQGAPHHLGHPPTPEDSSGPPVQWRGTSRSTCGHCEPCTVPSTTG